MNARTESHLEKCAHTACAAVFAHRGGMKFVGHSVKTRHDMVWSAVCKREVQPERWLENDALTSATRINLHRVASEMFSDIQTSRNRERKKKAQRSSGSEKNKEKI